MLFVVVTRTLGSIVERFVLLRRIPGLIPAGTVAPPYHLNLIYKATSTSYYAIHGGYCSYGFYCGVFSIVLSAAASWTNWGDGAALSFKPSLLFIFRFNYI